MPESVRRRLWISAAIGFVLMLVPFGCQALRADAAPRRVTADVCSLVRPKTIAVLVPRAYAPESGVEDQGSVHLRYCDFLGRSGENYVTLSIIVARFGRVDQRSPAQVAHLRAAVACLNCDRPVVRRIGDEAFGYVLGESWVWVSARLGSLVVQVQYKSPDATQEALLEAAEVVAQEVAARCGC
jgi:hypothetical protein